MDNFLIYRASAGTGKTFSLVKEYLSVILREPDGFKHTLAITFTNKASEEMKSRILLHLNNIANGCDDSKTETWRSMVPALLESTGLNEETLIEKSKIVLGHILHNYSYFSVGTIDSFAHTIVQIFAKEMQLPINFELELDAEGMIAQAIDLLISQAGEEGDAFITEILVDFTKQNIENNKSADITRDINAFANKTLREDGIEQRTKLAEFTPQDLQEKGRHIQKALKNYSEEVLQLAKPVWTQIKHLESAFYQGSRGLSSFFRKLTEDPRSFPSNKYLQQTIDEKKWFSAKASIEEKNEIEVLKPYIEETYAFLSHLMEKNKTKVIVWDLVLKRLHAIMLLNEINRCMTQIREETGTVHISEMNKRIADIIKKEPIPFIYERIGTRYRNYLIDEFQDTSVLQWNNLIPLILNSLAEKGLSMIVGDGKQAIYRWRSGEVEQFERLSALNEQQAVDEIEKIFLQNMRVNCLTQNFRSDKEIVDFTNKLFEYAKQYIPVNYYELKNVYSDLVLTPDQGKSEGFVAVHFVAESENKSYQDEMCSLVDETVKQLLKRNFSYADIAILCRLNRESSQVAQYLSEQGIPVASSDSLKLTSSETVRLICSALHYLATPDAINRVIFWLQLWKTKHLSWDDELMKQMPGINKKQFQKFLNHHGIKIDFQQIEELLLYDAATLLMTTLNLSPLNDVYLRFFLDGLVDAQAKGVTSLKNFPEWWNETGQKLSLSIPENSNAVKVMTVHKAKGLGFPVVIYPFADTEFKKSIDDVWINLDEEEYFLPAALLSLNQTLLETDFAHIYEKEQAKSVLDLLNTFYVACTRPKHELYIFSKSKEKYDSAKINIPDILHQFLLSEQKWNECEHSYSFGIQRNNPQKGKEQTPKDFDDAVVLKPWQERISIRNHAHQFWDNDKTDYGNMVHHVLGKIKTVADIPLVINQLQTSGITTADETENIKTMLHNIVKHPELQPYFDTKNLILCEQAILLPEQGEFRPDRVAISENDIRILDYKTGKKSPEHALQLQKYAAELEKMGYNVIDKKIVYLKNEFIEIEVLT